MKRESYKKGPRFGPDAWDYHSEAPSAVQIEAQEIVSAQPIVEAKADIIVEKPVAEIVSAQQEVVEIKTSTLNVSPTPVVQDAKIVDKKKK